MHAFLKFADMLSLVGAVVASLALAALVVMGGSEVLLRSFFSTSLSFVVEYNGYLLALTFLGGCGQAMREGGHIRVTMLLQSLPDRVAKGLDVACTIVGLFLAAYLFIAMGKLAYGSYQYGTLSFFTSRTPLVYPQAATALMLGIFVLSVAARLVRLLIGQPPEKAAAATGVTH